LNRRLVTVDDQHARLHGDVCRGERRGDPQCDAYGGMARDLGKVRAVYVVAAIAGSRRVVSRSIAGCSSEASWPWLASAGSPNRSGSIYSASFARSSCRIFKTDGAGLAGVVCFTLVMKEVSWPVIARHTARTAATACIFILVVQLVVRPVQMESTLWYPTRFFSIINLHAG
jgi:hypothetical protein